MHSIKHINPEFVDARGAISKILDESGVTIKSILLITSKAGAIRANHYHKQDSHYCYLLSGKMEYYEKPVDGGKRTSTIVEAGDMVYSPPMIMHAMKFLEDTVFLAFATEHRSQNAYEEDLVRVQLI